MVKKEGTDAGTGAPSWAQVANADIEEAVLQEELNYAKANVRKMSPRAVAGVICFFVIYTIALYFFFSRH